MLCFYDPSHLEKCSKPGIRPYPQPYWTYAVLILKIRPWINVIDIVWPKPHRAFTSCPSIAYRVLRSFRSFKAMTSARDRDTASTWLRCWAECRWQVPASGLQANASLCLSSFFKFIFLTSHLPQLEQGQGSSFDTRPLENLKKRNRSQCCILELRKSRFFISFIPGEWANGLWYWLVEMITSSWWNCTARKDARERWGNQA